MDLIVIRHAEAEPTAAGQTDAQRALSEHGRRRFTELVRRLDELPPRIGRLAASPYLRAQQTARLLGEIQGWGTPESWPELQPEGDPAAVLRRLRDDPAPSTALVTHQPLVGRLIARLTHQDPAFPPGAIAWLELDGSHARLRWSASP